MVYSNGVTLDRSFDAATGIPTSRYTDGDGGTWTETVTATTQTGRILAHRFDTPTTSAVYSYGYDPTSGQLTDATLDVTGDHTLTAVVGYTNGYTDGRQLPRGWLGRCSTVPAGRPSRPSMGSPPPPRPATTPTVPPSASTTPPATTPTTRPSWWSAARWWPTAISRWDTTLRAS